MIRSKPWLALIAALVPLGMMAQMNPVAFEKFQLNNGLKVLLHEDHSAPVVTVSVLYHVGTKNEKPQRSGFAHFFEHLLFEGSANIARGEFDRYTKAAGAVNNAYTMQDRTYYFESLPSNQLPLALWLESERMLHARVEQKSIEVQREVVKEERRENYDNQPYGTIVEEIMKRLFIKHPYRITPIGSLEDINAAQEQDFIEFYRDFYRPDNAVLTIAGDIDPKVAKELVNRYFATIPKPQTPIFRPTIVEPPLPKEIRDTVFDRVQLPAYIAAFRAPAQNTDDYYAMTLLNNLLASGESSRIYRRLVDEEQLAIQAGSFAFGLEDPGASIMYGIANLGVDLQKIEAAIDDEIKKLQQELISEREMEKLRNQIENELVNRNASIAGIAENLAIFETHYGDANLINTEINRYLKITREDIQRVARQYLQPNQRVVLFWMPKNEQ